MLVRLGQVDAAPALLDGRHRADHAGRRERDAGPHQPWSVTGPTTPRVRQSKEDGNDGPAAGLGPPTVGVIGLRKMSGMRKVMCRWAFCSASRSVSGGVRL